MDQIANTNFMVYITNSYCMLRKIRKFWLQDCSNEEIKENIDKLVDLGLKVCIDIMSQVIGQGIIAKINVHTKNYAMV